MVFFTKAPCPGLHLKRLFPPTESQGGTLKRNLQVGRILPTWNYPEIQHWGKSERFPTLTGEGKRNELRVQAHN